MRNETFLPHLLPQQTNLLSTLSNLFSPFPSDSTRAGIPPSAKMRINGAPIAGGGGGGGGGLIASD